MTFPEDFSLENDYRFDITPLSLADANCYVFAVSNGIQVRVLAAQLTYIKDLSRHINKNIDIHEAFISTREIEEMAKALKVD